MGGVRPRYWDVSACGLSYLHSCCQQRIHHERIQHLQKAQAELGESCTCRPAACSGPGANLELGRCLLVLCHKRLHQVIDARHCGSFVCAARSSGSRGCCCDLQQAQGDSKLLQEIVWLTQETVPAGCTACRSKQDGKAGKQAGAHRLARWLVRKMDLLRSCIVGPS